MSDIDGVESGFKSLADVGTIGANSPVNQPAQSPPASDAFARVCKYGDQMLCYGGLMAISALATGFGLEWGWTPLVVLGIVLLWTFGGAFSDARRMSNAAVEHHEALIMASDQTGDSLLVRLWGFRRPARIIVRTFTMFSRSRDDDRSEAPQGL